MMRDEAEARAEAILFRHLSPAQQHEWRRYQRITEQGVEIAPNQHAIRWMGGSNYQCITTHPDPDSNLMLPYADQALALLLLVRTCPSWLSTIQTKPRVRSPNGLYWLLLP